DANGAVLPPPVESPAGLADRGSLDKTLAPMGQAARHIEDQTVGYIPLARGDDPTALSEVVLTKVLDWDGKNLGALVLGFPIQNISSPGVQNNATNGIWLKDQLYIKSLSAPDRHLLAQK